MTLDIRGSIKNTKLSSNQYAVFEELISNAIDAYLIRKNQESSVPSLKIRIDMEFRRYDLLEDRDTILVSCRDNGSGLGDDQLKAFLTKDTSYKDDLKIPGIGKCKGAGRIQFFHHFSALFIESAYRDEDGIKKRTLIYSEPQKEINFNDFVSSVGVESEIGTYIRLDGFKDAIRHRVFHNATLTELFSASALKKQMLVTFLQRLVSLGDNLGEFEIVFVTHHWKTGSQTESIQPADLPSVTNERVVNIEEQDPQSGGGLGVWRSFKISHYLLNASQYALPKNAIAFCAKSSPVKDITDNYLKTRTEQNNPVGGYHHIVLIESDYLDQHVNEQRDDFDDIPNDIPSGDLFLDATISYAAIHDTIDPIIQEMVAPADWNKEQVLKEVVQHFGVTKAMLADTSTKVVYGESAQSVVERVLKKYQERVVSETAALLSLKSEIIKMRPDSEEFRNKINELSWQYTASLKNFEMASLSQLVVRRAAIVEILSLACGRALAMQDVAEGERRKDEKIIHNIFFPMRRDSTQVSDHDMWLLSEEYYYFDYISSDMPLSDIAWDGGQKVFDVGIDEMVLDVLVRRAKENGGKRPDIALFSDEGSAVIIEFKAPGVSVDEHIGDLSEYAQILAAKSRGKLQRFYCYLIGDEVKPIRLQGWIPHAIGKGWFQSSDLIDPDTRVRIGSTYFEILHYDDVVERARKRIGVYQEKLNLNLRDAQ